MELEDARSLSPQALRQRAVATVAKQNRTQGDDAPEAGRDPHHRQLGYATLSRHRAPQIRIRSRLS